MLCPDEFEMHLRWHLIPSRQIPNRLAWPMSMQTQVEPVVIGFQKLHRIDCQNFHATGAQ